MESMALSKVEQSSVRRRGIEKKMKCSHSANCARRNAIDVDYVWEAQLILIANLNIANRFIFFRLFVSLSLSINRKRYSNLGTTALKQMKWAAQNCVQDASFQTNSRFLSSRNRIKYIQWKPIYSTLADRLQKVKNQQNEIQYGANERTSERTGTTSSS